MTAGLEAAIGAGVPLIVWESARLIARKIGRAKTIPERMDRVEVILIKHSEELAVQTDAQFATLEALEGNCNGNVTIAKEKILAMKEKRDKFYRESAIKRQED